MKQENSEDKTISPKSQKIHPLIVYPFSHPQDTANLSFLYNTLIKELWQQTDIYSTPITILNRQTYHKITNWDTDKYKKSNFNDFLENTVKKYSTIHHAWCVDSCQMWLSGFGAAYDNKESNSDVFWIIPGDFNYAKVDNIIDKIKKIPMTVAEGGYDLCLGEIKVDVNSSKQLIDTYGTYGLLYNWFPIQAQQIRKITNKPRSEFFAINYKTLDYVIKRRWYAYEQMIVILLHAILRESKICAVGLGDLSDLDQGRDSLSAAMQQVERTERVLKLHWRELFDKQRELFEKQEKNWTDEFRKKDAQSGQIRGAALVILEQILGKKS